MTGKKVVIIGAGIAGLSAGCYLQMNGYESEIYELHDIAGGLCTSWERKGYTFDGCIHWLVGSSASNSLFDIWTELGGINKETVFHNSEIFSRIEAQDGTHFSVYTDVEKLEEEMLRLSSEDNEIIKEFTDAIRFFVSFQCSRDNPPPPKVQRTFAEKIPPFIRKWSSISIDNFTKQITNPVLRMFFGRIFGEFIGESSSIFMLLATLGYMHAKTAGYPIGGSKPFAERIEKKYLDLGGKIHFNARVMEILVENNEVKGIQLTNEEIIQADIVISAADGYDTIYKMLKGKYLNEEIDGYYNNLEPFPSICQLSLGVAHEFKDTPHSIQFFLEEPIKVDPKTTLKEINIRLYNFDPTLAPMGKTSIISFFASRDYEYWTSMREKNRKLYNETKEKLANEIIKQLEKRLPNIKSKIEVVDVSTPATFIRYTNNWKGSYEGWLPNTQLSGRSITETLPGLENFFMVGHWTRPGGGLPPAAMSGKRIATLICEQDGKEFTISKSSN